MRPIVLGAALVWLIAVAAASGVAAEGDFVIRRGTSPAISTLADALAKAKPGGRDKLIEGFITAHESKFPLIEDSVVTYVYRGKVAVGVFAPSDLNRWDTAADPLERLDGTDLYYRTIVLPRDARIDYKFYVDGAWILDPLNPVRVRGGFGDNSALAMPEYVEPTEIVPNPDIAHGTIDTHQFTSALLGNARKVQVYLPAGYKAASIENVADGLCGGPSTTKSLGFAGTYPVLFVQDGSDYITLGSMVNVLDNLIARGAIPPVVAVFVDPVDRNQEYWLNAAYERMLVEELVPFIRARYDVASDPSKIAIMGASLGGEISVMIALDHPEVFGKCASQSGVVGTGDGRLVAAVKAAPRRAVDFYLDCGRFGDATEENREMRDALGSAGYHFKYQEFDEGHSWGNWRAHLDDLLIFFWGKDGTR